jgi:hypothetical protein
MFIIAGLFKLVGGAKAMSVKKRMIYGLIVICLFASLSIAWPASADLGNSQDKKEDKGDKKKKDDKDKKDKKDKSDADEISTGRAVMWQEPTDIESRDLFNGPGGAGGAPNPSGKFTFVRRSTAGTSEKIIVDDDKGRSWTVKFGPEARPEVSASRLIWAAGYQVDDVYFVKRAHIEGRGGFDVWDVRYERRDNNFKELGTWSWLAGPFAGTRDLQGLKTLMALINNWDLKDENNKVVRPNKESGGDRELRIYYVGDLGGTLGSTGNAIRKIPGFGNAPAGSKGNPDSYSRQVFIDGVKGGQVVFHYNGKNPKALEGVTVENARWMGNLLGRLSDKQIGDAFRAGGFTEAEVATYVRAVRGRIDQLKNLK